MEGSFIVVTAEKGTGDGRFSVAAAPAEAEAQIRRLVERGTPPESIRVYRAQPLQLRLPAPVAL